MSDEVSEQQQEARSVVNDASEPQPAIEAAGDDAEGRAAGAASKLVPVNEAIKYRRRAQQAESRLQQSEQQLKDLQTQLEARLEQLATAEAQRDELQHQLETSQVRTDAERMLHAAGVNDIETGMALLEKRFSFSDGPQPEQLSQAVQRLVRDKAFLTASPQVLPAKTASRRIQERGAAWLAQGAARAAQSGNRREVAEYLRLRRGANTKY